MGEITQFPVRPVRRRTVTAREIHAAPKPSDEMVWNVCPYLLKGEHHQCLACPEWEHDEMAARYSEDGSDLVQRGCRVMAEEACRIVLAQQIKERASDST